MKTLVTDSGLLHLMLPTVVKRWLNLLIRLLECVDYYTTGRIEPTFGEKSWLADLKVIRVCFAVEDSGTFR